MLKGQDILILLKLSLKSDEKYLLQHIALSIGVSISEVSKSLSRCEQSFLYESQRRRVNRVNLFEFIVHGLKYVFPARLGAPAIGVATAWGDRDVFRSINHNSQEIPVWPKAGGRVRGFTVEPIYESVTLAVENDPNLYHLLTAIDGIRLGGTREVKVGSDFIRKVLINGFP